MARSLGVMKSFLSTLSVWRVLLGLAASVVLVVLSFLVGQWTAQSPGLPSEAMAPAAGGGPAGFGPMIGQARVQEGDPLAVGPVDAPVVMVLFSDYRCPFCARFSNVTEPVLVERFVEAGLLRIEWRDLPLYGEASLLAARAARAAAEQGMFWEFTRAVYAAAPENGHHELTEARLRDLAVQVDLPDLEAFMAGMVSSRFDEAIQADLQQAQRLGISGTPSFVINGHPVVGAQPTEVFVEFIEGLLVELDG